VGGNAGSFSLQDLNLVFSHLKLSRSIDVIHDDWCAALRRGIIIISSSTTTTSTTNTI